MAHMLDLHSSDVMLAGSLFQRREGNREPSRAEIRLSLNERIGLIDTDKADPQSCDYYLKASAPHGVI